MPAKLTRDEAIHLVERIMRLDYADNAELNDWLDRLERDLGYLDISDLIFTVVPELTPAEIVDRASAYEPIAMRTTPWTEPSTT
ncbi:e9imm peptide [Micromonospora sp. CPCC 205546]|uniref:e9imm peptide n=1 Tax=Micromonospora sp. CPCC 205546 TaxID=3122397 RepID=UPI002FEE6BA8